MLALVDQPEELVASFGSVLPFGTAGRRGPVGVGPNRINAYTVATSVMGHVAWLRRRFPDVQDLRVVIACDVRAFADHRGRFGQPVPGLHGLSSRDLAEVAARVYAAHRVHCWRVPPGQTRYVSTPELSFTLRGLGAHGGLNLSASHNPPDDNGVKVYDERGAQLVPPYDQELLEAVEAVQDVLEPSEEDCQRYILDLDPSWHEAYVEHVASLAEAGPRELRVAVSPLHGTGRVQEVLVKAGFQVGVVANEAAPDGRFPTVPGGVANPESPAVFGEARRQFPEADLLLATDPDADRIGAQVKHRGEWVHLSGNDIACLVVDERLRRDPTKALVVRTEVTTSLVSRLARARGAVVVDHLLVGFKYIGDLLARIEDGASELGQGLEFRAGVEESNGVLTSAAMRDKDAAGGALALACLAARLAGEGLTLVDHLGALKHRHGWILNGQLKRVFEGAEGAVVLARLLENWRIRPPADLAGRVVLRTVDHLDPAGVWGPYRSATDRASRNVFGLELSAGAQDDGARLVLRPSGTEPILKVYWEVAGRPGLSPAQRAGLTQDAQELVQALQGALANG